MTEQPEHCPKKQDMPLSGKKIAVIIDNLYIAEEIDAYLEHFGRMGAEVELVTRMWGQPKRVYFSDEISDLEPDRAGKIPTSVEVKHITVKIDVDSVKPSDYAAVLMAANYTSVRLRMFDRAHAASPDTAPAVRFFAAAMRSPTVVKGALCHGLWILAPVPELLRGRHVTCHEVVHADIANAGALIHTDKVVKDGDLVTGHSKHEATVPTDADGIPPYIQAVADQIIAYGNSKAASPARTPSWSSDVLPRNKEGSRRILVVLSEWGYWGEELVGPLDVFHNASYDVDFVTPNGHRPPAIAVSLSTEFMDPPLGKHVVSESVAKLALAVDGKNNKLGMPWSGYYQDLNHPYSLAAKLPELPYWSDQDHLRRMEEYYRARDAAWKEFVKPYDALLIVGGSGPLVDLANNQRVHDLILGFLAQDKPVAAECYGVACLAFARDLDSRKSLLWGKHVTGHCREYDYKDGTGFEGNHFVDGSTAGFGGGGKYINFGPPFYPLEYILRDATGPDGGYHGNVGRESSVIVDYPFITGRSTPDSYLTGQKLVEVLEAGLKRYGW